MAGKEGTTGTLEAQDTPNESSKLEDLDKLRPQIVASIVINLASLSCGFACSWGNVSLTSDKGAMEVIALPIGAILGAIVSGLLLNRIGRKWFLYSTSIPFVVAPIITYFVKSWPALVAARLIVGLSVGATFATIPVYLGELTEARIRGAAIAMMPLLFSLGYLVMVGVSTLLNETMLSFIGLIPRVLFLLSAPWVPESPYYDLKRKKVKCAALSLAWLRRKRTNDQEMKEMQEFIESEDQGGYVELFTIPVYRKALLIVLLLSAGQQLSGLIAILPYADSILEQMKLPINFLLITSAVLFVTSIISASVVDIFGRKPLFLVSSYGSSLCLLLSGAYALLTKMGRMKLGKLSWIPVIAALLNAVFFAFGLAPIPQVHASELFKVETKSWANAVVVIFQSLLAIIVAEIYRPLVGRWGFEAIFFLLGAIELVVAILASIFMPETKRKSFADVQKILSGSAPGEQSPASTEQQ